MFISFFRFSFSRFSLSFSSCSFSSVFWPPPNEVPRDFAICSRSFWYSSEFSRRSFFRSSVALLRSFWHPSASSLHVSIRSRSVFKSLWRPLTSKSFFFSSSSLSTIFEWYCWRRAFLCSSISSCFSRKRRWNLWSNSARNVPKSCMCSSVRVLDAFCSCTKSCSFSMSFFSSTECLLLIWSSRCLNCRSNSLFVKSISCWWAFTALCISSLRLWTWSLRSWFSTLKDANITS